jgi:hypothetical protein
VPRSRVAGGAHEAANQGARMKPEHAHSRSGTGVEQQGNVGERQGSSQCWTGSMSVFRNCCDALGNTAPMACCCGCVTAHGGENLSTNESRGRPNASTQQQGECRKR